MNPQNHRDSKLPPTAPANTGPSRYGVPSSQMRNAIANNSKQGSQGKKLWVIPMPLAVLLILLLILTHLPPATSPMLLLGIVFLPSYLTGVLVMWGLSLDTSKNSSPNVKSGGTGQQMEREGS